MEALPDAHPILNDIEEAHSLDFITITKLFNYLLQNKYKRYPVTSILNGTGNDITGVAIKCA